MIIHSKKLSTFLVAALLLSVSTAQAAARPDTRNMSCAAAISLVQSYGAIVLSTGRYTYDRYVKNHAYCSLNEGLKNAYVPTADSRRCKIGYTCVDQILLFDRLSD